MKNKTIPGKLLILLFIIAFIFVITHDYEPKWKARDEDGTMRNFLRKSNNRDNKGYYDSDEGKVIIFGGSPRILIASYVKWIKEYPEKAANIDTLYNHGSDGTPGYKHLIIFYNKELIDTLS